jgi:four helix bundle protein
LIKGEIKMSYQNFETLMVWEKARLLKKEISILVKNFPVEEKFRLSDQLIRSSRSVGTQVAEGHGRQTIPDRVRFCVIARGSLSETLNHLIDAFDEEYIKEEQLNYFKNKITEVEKLLNGYITYLKKKHDEESPY